MPKRLAAVLALATTVACSNPNDPQGDNQTPVGAPSITCPADVTVEVTTTLPLVTYANPVTSNGTPPVTTSCNPASGSKFPLGTTDVVCRATDAVSRTAQCVFHVVVKVIPRLMGTRVLVFGDSITEGEVAPPYVPQVLDPAHSYPTVLRDLLTQRYKSQTIILAASGVGGEQAVLSEQRFKDALLANHPDTVLLFEGTNDVNVGTDPAVVAASLRRDIVAARQSGVKQVFLATILPQIQGLPQAFNPAGVVPMNNAIRGAAFLEGAVFVDSYSVFQPRLLELIGNDGLHPTIAGHQVLAETFLQYLIAHYEEPLPPGLTTP